MENHNLQPMSHNGKLNKSEKFHQKNLSLRNKIPIQKRDDSSLDHKFKTSANSAKATESIPVAGTSASPSSHIKSSNVQNSDRDDSLCDFRSPIKSPELDESLADFIIKPTVLISNKRLASRESKPLSKKKKCSRNVSIGSNQPSIESSFFKPKTTMQPAFLCPLCFKSYKDATAQNNHMKSCAAKNKISTKKLLDAIELQEKQANERKAMGLLTAPPIQPKKTISRKLISNKDPQLQLALALSMSLHEAQVNEEIDDAYVLAGEPSFSMNEETSDDRRETLQKFGFTTNKPVVVPTAAKSRKKRLMGPTPLQTRTQEERDRLLTVKIAEVLMGDEAITQAAQKSMDKVIKFESTIVLKSRLLQSYHCVMDRLWDKTQQRLEGWSPYSCNILEYTPSKASPEPEIEEIEPGLCTASILPNNSTETLNQIAAVDEVEENIQSTSPLLKSTSKKSDVANDKTAALNADNNSLKNLSRDWGTMFGSNYMSDVVVITKGNIEISGHLIVFWARCSNIMAEVIPHDPERCGQKKAKILWLDTCSVVANVFFEYIYCGTIDRNQEIFEDPRKLSGVRALARKYQLKELFTYLKDKSNELKVNEANILKQPPSTNNERSESKLCVSSQNSFDSHSEGEASISSMKTDIYTECRTLSSARAKSAIIKKSTSDNNIPKENRRMRVSHNSKDEYHISTSNDSCVTDIYTTGEAVCEMMSVTKIGQKSVTNSDHSDDDSKLINQGLKVERSISPDIFDDTTTEDHSNSNRLSQPYSHRSEFNTEYCKVELGPTSKNLKVKSADLHGRSHNCRSSSDRESSDGETVGTSKRSYIRESERTTVEFAFVSTRRKQRSFRLFPADEITEIDTPDQQSDVPEPVTRPKGDVTMAIERIQKLNAKTASESDSECESTEKLPMRRHTNPFRRSFIKSSSMIHKNVKDDVGSESDVEIHRVRKRNALSIFEQKLETAVANNPELFNLPYSDPPAEGYSTERESPKHSKSKASSNVQNEKLNHCPDNPPELSQRRFSELLDTTGGDFDLTRDSFEESRVDTDIDTCNTIVEDKDLSIFSKYKKNRRHNSISKYRAALQDITIPTFVSDNRVMDETLSNDICQSSDDGKSNKDEVIIYKKARTESCRSSSSKNKSSHLSQCALQTHKELSTAELKDGEQIIVSSESCNSTDLNDKEHSPMKQNDFELSDLEIDLSDFSGMRSSNKFSNGELNSVNGDKSTTRTSDYRLLDGEQAANYTFRQIGSFTDVKLSDTEFSNVKKNGSEENNSSDVDTDTEYCVKSADPRQPTTYEVTERSEEIIPDIHDEDTDLGGMKNDQPSRKIPSKVEIHKTDTVSREASRSPSFGQVHLDLSSSDCEISGIFPPPSINFDELKNVSNEVDALLDECKMSSQIFRDSELNSSHHNSGVLSLDSLALSSTPVIRKENYNNIVPSDKLTDAKSDLMVDITNEDSFEAECQNTKSFDTKLVGSGREREKETHDPNTKVPFFALDSSSSDNSEFNIRKTQNTESYALSDKYKSIRKQSTQPRCNTVLPDKNSKSNVKTFGVRSISENTLNTTPTDGANFMNDSFDNEFARVLTPPLQNENISSTNNQSTPQQEIISENVTPLANYSAMKTPELRKELHKYGFKAQKRDRAKQLLRHIYNELHPLVPVVQTNIALNFTESSSEDERPLPKKQNRSKSFEILNRNNIQSQHETFESDTRTLSDASNDNELLEDEDLHNMSQSDGDENLETVFRKLLEVDINLHNKILTYEPLILEELHATLKAQGLKCKLNSLMDFLDEQCITFRTLASSKRNRTRHKASPKKHQATQ